MKKPVLIIAEAGVNHNGELEKAYELIEKASDAGADVIKFQTFEADKLLTHSAKKALKDAGADNIEICETAGYPIVYGEKIIDTNLPTVLVYGHYDVQPADPLELWTSGPFEPVIKTFLFVKFIF